jgi:hypothetical protein
MVELLELEVVSTRREIGLILAGRRLLALFYNTPGLRRTLLHVRYNTAY